MEKRYQVFISSTYADLKDERDHVFRTLMEMDCIPAGMELFPAIDDEQWLFIKKVIDDCDYYLLIIGGRYGSLSEEGISFTEKEFDYAVSKGLKVVALIHGAPDDIPVGKSEKDPALRAKLSVFTEKAKAGRLVKFWTKAAELPGLVSLSLTSTIKRYPAVGWVRASQAPTQEILGEINELRKEREKLLGEMIVLRTEIQVAKTQEIEGIADIDSLFTVSVSYRSTSSGGLMRTYKTDVDTTWREIFAFISPFLISIPNEKSVKLTLADALFAKSKKPGHRETIDEQQFKTIGLQLAAYDLVKIKNQKTVSNTTSLFWYPTEKGNRLMLESRLVRAAPQDSDKSA
jgi:hypothetical protein